MFLIVQVMLQASVRTPFLLLDLFKVIMFDAS